MIRPPVQTQKHANKLTLLYPLPPHDSTQSSVTPAGQWGGCRQPMNTVDTLKSNLAVVTLSTQWWLQFKPVTAPLVSRSQSGLIHFL